MPDLPDILHALECLTLGLKPIIYERGKDVRLRRRDLKAIQQFSLVDPDSNYCFGEGGAGTYSDGKLYTRSTKRGNVREVLETLVMHGAKEEILIDAHPHIGSNKLPGIIAGIRQTIIDHGGEVHFGSRLSDFRIADRSITELVINDSEVIPTDAVILATGHSARDIYDLLWEHEVKIEVKPFALGVRIEHPQALIDSIQYNRTERGEHLPPAAYSLTCQVDDQVCTRFVCAREDLSYRHQLRQARSSSTGCRFRGVIRHLPMPERWYR